MRMRSHHHLLVDRCVAKYFDDGVLYEGKVEYYDKPYFHVVYQDGDGADYNVNELLEILIDYNIAIVTQTENFILIFEWLRLIWP